MLTFEGNPNLKSEQGDTYTAGIVFNSPWDHALLQRITATVDWYRIKITDPIDVLSGQLILNACFNVDGTNPTYALNDPSDYCRLIERDPNSGAIRTVSAQYANIGELGVEGVDTAIRWSAPMADLGLQSLPGTLSVSVGANFLMDQSQPVTVGGEILNFAGYAGASKIRTNTVFGYNWNDNRVSLTWLFRKGTEGLLTTNRPSPTIARLSVEQPVQPERRHEARSAGCVGERQQPVRQGTGVGRLLRGGCDRWFRHVRSVRRSRRPSLFGEFHDGVLTPPNFA